jgi:DNA-binding CsgD family transcriptional regulator
VGVASFIRARDRLLAADIDEVAVGPMCEEIVHAFHDIVLFDKCALMTTDPETLLPSSGVVEGFAADACAPFWDNELLDPDFNKFTQLARSHDPVVTLVEATDGDLSRSPRYQKLYSLFSATDELRTAFVAGSTCLAIGAFVRPGEAGVFSVEELANARQLVPVVTTVLRRALGRVTAADRSDPPVMIILDSNDEIITTTPGAAEVLDALRGVDDEELPAQVRAAATKARWGRMTTNLSTRIRDGKGNWLRLYVSPVEGELGSVVLLFERARPDDLARILLDSYGLTHRETEIVLLLARGLSAKEIAAELALSPHTVRDHIKSIYDKADVSSRGELVATLFSNHVIHWLHSAVTTIG